MKLIIAILLLVSSFSAMANEVRFSGRIKNSTITAVLQFDDKKGITGYYYYNKYKVKIPLVGGYVKDEWDKYWKQIELKSTDKSLGEEFYGFVEERHSPNVSTPNRKEISGYWRGSGNAREDFILIENSNIDLTREKCRDVLLEWSNNFKEEYISIMYICKELKIYDATEDADGSRGMANWVSSEEAVSGWLLGGEIARVRALITDKEDLKLFEDSQLAWKKFTDLNCNLEEKFSMPLVGSSYSRSYGGSSQRICLYESNYERAKYLFNIFTSQTSNWHHEQRKRR